MLSDLSLARDPTMNAAVRKFLSPERPEKVIIRAMSHLFDRDPSSVPVVERLLTDKRLTVRILAAAYLYRLGQEHRVEQIAREIANKEMGTMAWAHFRSYFHRGVRMPPVVLDAVVARAEVESQFPAGRPRPTSFAAQLLATLAEARYRKAIPIMKKLLKHHNERVARAAFDALVAFRDVLTPETLRHQLKTEKGVKRLWAADALRRMDDDSGFETVLAALKREPKLRVDAAKILGGFGRAESVEPLIDALLDENRQVRASASGSLQRVLIALFPYRRISFSALKFYPYGAEAGRKAAVAKVRVWWEAHKDDRW